MASLTMDNPLSPSPKVQLARNLQDVQDCIHDMKNEFDDTGIPINDDNQTLHRFCAKLEFLLQSGFKVRVGLLGGKKDYWNYFLDCLSSVKGLSDGIKFVKSLSELKTSLGRGRALIRFGLVHHRLADTIQQCVFNTKATVEWYHPKALWFQQDQSSLLINSLYDLNDLQFDLSPRGYDLDTAWPTFARKQFGSQQTWAPPSRSISINSLGGTQENLAASFTPSLVTEPEVENLKHDLSDMENEKLSLESKVEELNKLKQAAEEKAKKLENQLHDLQIAYSNFQVRYEKVATELKVKEDGWAEKEQVLKDQIAAANRSVGDIKSADASNFDVTELRIKLLARDKLIKANSLEMQALTKDLESKTKLEAQKTRLIELLDRKVNQQDGIIKELKGKVAQKEEKTETVKSETVDKGHDEKVSTLEKQVKDLQQKLTATEDAYVSMKKKHEDSEKVNAELRESSEEFRKMLNSMEEKGMKIAKIAKEKLTSYSDANKQLKADMETLSKSMTDLREAGATSKEGPEIDALRAENSELKKALAEAQGELNKMKNLKGEMENKITKMEGQEEVLKKQQTDLEQKLEQQQNSAEQLKSELSGLKSAVSQLDSADSSRVSYGKSSKRRKNKGGGQGQDRVPLEAKVKAVLEEKSLLQMSLRSAEAKLTQLTADLQTSQIQVKELEARETHIQLENTELKTLISQMEVKDADMGSKVEKLEADLHQSDLDMAEVKEELEKEANRSKDLKSKVEELEGVCLSKEQSIKDLFSTKEGVDKEFESVQSKLMEVIKQREELQGQNKSLQTKLEAGVKEVENVKVNIEKMKQEKEVLFQENKKLESKLEKMAEEAQMWKKNAVELEENLTKSLEEKLEGLTARLREEQKSRHTLETDLEKLRQQNRENEEKFNLIEKNHEMKETEYQAKLKENESKLEKIHKDKEDLENQAEKLLLEKEEFEKKMNELKMENVKLKSDVETATSDIETLKEEVESLKSLLSRLEGEKEKCNKINENLKEEVEQHVKDNMSLREEINISTSALKTIENELNDVKSALKDKDKELKSLNVDFKSVNDEKEAVKLKLEESLTEITCLKQEILTMQNENSCISENLNKQSSDMEQKMSTINSEKSELDKKLEVALEEKTQVESALVDLQGMWCDQEKKLEEKQDEVVSLQEELGTVKRNYCEVVAELENVRKSRKEFQDEVDASRDAMEKEVSALKFQLSSEQMQFQEKLKSMENQQTNVSEMAQQVAAQESLIETLELEVEHLKRQRSVDQEQQKLELEDLRQLLGNREDECRIISGDLKRTSSLLDEERNLVLKFKNEVTEKQKQLEKEKELNEKEKNILKNDNLDLKKKLIRLVKDKESLWLKTDKLEYVHKLLAASKWMEDGEATHCLGCKNEFSFRLRKHHCRLCGKIFCHACASHFIMTSHSSKQKRVCNECFILQNQVKQPLSREPSPLPDVDIVETPTEVRGHSWSTSQSGTDEADEEQETQGTVDQSSDKKDTIPENELPAGQPETPQEVPPENSEESPREEERVKFQIGSVFTTESPPRIAETSQISESQRQTDAASENVDQRKAEEWRDEGGATFNPDYAKETDEYKLAVGEKGAEQSAEFDDEAFDLITDDEIACSIHEPNPDPNMYGCPTLSLADIGSEGHSSDDDLWVIAGKIFCVPIEINRPGVVLSWEFTTEHKNIHFSVRYKESDFAPSDSAEELIPTCKCNSHKYPVQGELTAIKTGVYMLLFDNSTSRFTAKKLFYKLQVKLPDEAE